MRAPVIFSPKFKPNVPRSVRRETQAMKRKRFSEEPIIGILRETETGTTAKEVCPRHGVSEQTFYAGRRNTAASRSATPSG